MGRNNDLNYYKYRETEYAKIIYENGFQSSHILKEARILSLYFRDVLNYKPKKRKEELYDFFSKNIEDYDEVVYYKTMDRALNYSKNKKNHLIDIDEILFYEEEMNYINSLDLSYNCKKILFTMLFCIKLSNRISKIKEKISDDNDICNYNYISKQITDNKIIKMSNIGSVKDNIQLFYILESDKYIKTYYTGSTELIFLNNIKYKKMNIAIKIKYFEDIGYYFDYYNKKNGIKLCSVCEKPFKSKTNNSKYCKEHSGNKEFESKKSTCKYCGNIFMPNKYSKRKDVCDTCYCENRKKMKKESKNKKS